MKIINVDEFRAGLYAISHGLDRIANSMSEDQKEQDEVRGTEEVISQREEEAREEFEKELDEVEFTEDLDEDGSLEELFDKHEEQLEEIQEKVDALDNREVEVLEKSVLEEMSYRDLQKLAKSQDILATGKTEELLERLVGVEVTEEVIEEVLEPEEEIEQEEVEEKETEEVVTDVEEELVEEEIEPEEEEVEVEIESKADKIEKALEDYTEEDLADVLDSVGISPKGKRQALIAKVVKAVDDGLLEIEIDEDTIDTEEVEVEEESIEEVEAEEEDITEARKSTIADIRSLVGDMLKEGEISEEEVNETLERIYGDDFDPKLPKGERDDMMLETYISLVDDEGVQHDLEEPYEKNGVFACCSKVLVKLDSGNLQCQVCNTEYEIG